MTRRASVAEVFLPGLQPLSAPSVRRREGGRVTGKPRDSHDQHIPLHSNRTLEHTDPPVGTAHETHGVVEQSRLSLALEYDHARPWYTSKQRRRQIPSFDPPAPTSSSLPSPSHRPPVDTPPADSPVVRMPTSPISPPYYYQNQQVIHKSAPVSVTPHTPPSPASVRMSSSAHNGKDQPFPTPPSSYVPTSSLSNRDLNTHNDTPLHHNSDMDTDMPDAQAQPPSLPSRPTLPLLCQSRKA
jgi:hypothetical protein